MPRVEYFQIMAKLTRGVLILVHPQQLVPPVEDGDILIMLHLIGLPNRGGAMVGPLRVSFRWMILSSI